MKNIIVVVITLSLLLSCFNSKAFNSCIDINKENDDSLNVMIELEFVFENDNVFAKIETTNCSNNAYYFIPSDVGKDLESTYRNFLVQKVNFFDEENKFLKKIEFIPSKRKTDYQKNISLIERLTIKPREKISGTYDLSKRYAFDSGLYLISFGATDYSFKEKVRTDGTQMQVMKSESYLIDLDTIAKKVLYVKKLNN